MEPVGIPPTMPGIDSPGQQSTMANMRRSRRLRNRREVREANMSRKDSEKPKRSMKAKLTAQHAERKNNTTQFTREGTFPFMSLPAELRINIYYMALSRNQPLLLHATRPAEKAEDFPRSSDSSDEETLTSPQEVMNSETRMRRRSSCSPLESAPPLHDPILPVILRLNRQIYKEARQVLYGDNVFTLSLSSGIYTLSTLHQRSRSLIKHVVLSIPSHYDILDGFADLVRLGLRYCWGLETFKIILPADLADEQRLPSPTTSVYANAFHILRWLPRGCSVELEGNVSEPMRRVVAEEGRLQNALDEVSDSSFSNTNAYASLTHRQPSYLKRQHQMPERH
jgi:epsin